jgi:biotin carboxylase
MIEINARLAGGMIPELVTHSTEIDLLKQQILQAVGSKPEWKTIHCKGYAGIHFLIVEEMGALSQICGAETVRTLAGVEDLQVKANIGQAVQPAKNFSHRLGHVIVRGETYQETVDRLEQAAQILKLKVHQERE